MPLYRPSVRLPAGAPLPYPVVGHGGRGPRRAVAPRAGMGARGFAEPAPGTVEWSPVYVGFLAYIFAITTYQLPIGQPAILLALVGLFLQRERVDVPPLIVTFVVFLAWCGLGIVHSRWPEVVREEVTNQAKLALILLAAVNALRTRAQIRTFVIFWVVCYVLYPVRGSFVNYFVAGYSVFGRAMWGNNIYGNPNDLAALCLLQIGLAAGLLVTEKGWIRMGAMVAVVLNSLLVAMTQSRAGILGLSVLVVLAVGGSRRRLQAIVMILIAGGVVATFAPSQVWDRLRGLRNVTDTSNLQAVDPEGSAEERFAIWRTSWQITADHPAQGVGWGTYALMNNVYAPLDGSRGRRLGMKDTHSTYFNTVAETGYPGLLLFLVLVGGTLRATDRVRRQCRADLPTASQQLFFLELGLLGFLVAGVFGSFAKLSFLYLILGLMYVLSRACLADLQRLRAGHGSTLRPS